MTSVYPIYPIIVYEFNLACFLHHLDYNFLLQVYGRVVLFICFDFNHSLSSFTRIHFVHTTHTSHSMQPAPPLPDFKDPFRALCILRAWTSLAIKLIMRLDLKNINFLTSFELQLDKHASFSFSGLVQASSVVEIQCLCLSYIDTQSVVLNASWSDSRVSRIAIASWASR